MYALTYVYTGHCAYEGPIECFQKELKVHDAELNKVYQDHLSNSGSAKLKQAERFWIKYKEADCNFFGSEVQGGRYYELVYYVCLINKTKNRINDLQSPLSYGGCALKKGYNDIASCLDNELKRYDTELSRLYIPVSGDNLLKKAEYSWIKFKDADCNYIASKISKSKEYMIVNSACLINRTKERVKEENISLFVKNWFKDY